MSAAPLFHRWGRRWLVMLIVLFIGPLSLCNSQSSLYQVAKIQFDTFKSMVKASCTSQGYHFYDMSSQACNTCSSIEEPDTSVLDALGDPISCKCAQGYYKAYANCFSVRMGGAEPCCSPSPAQIVQTSLIHRHLPPHTIYRPPPVPARATHALPAGPIVQPSATSRAASRVIAPPSLRASWGGSASAPPPAPRCS